MKKIISILMLFISINSFAQTMMQAGVYKVSPLTSKSIRIYNYQNCAVSYKITVPFGITRTVIIPAIPAHDSIDYVFEGCVTFTINPLKSCKESLEVREFTISTCIETLPVGSIKSFNARKTSTGIQTSLQLNSIDNIKEIQTKVSYDGGMTWVTKNSSKPANLYLVTEIKN